MQHMHVHATAVDEEEERVPKKNIKKEISGPIRLLGQIKK